MYETAHKPLKSQNITLYNFMRSHSYPPSIFCVLTEQVAARAKPLLVELLLVTLCTGQRKYIVVEKHLKSLTK